MKNWNYRIVKTYHKETEEHIYGIHEAHYDEKGDPKTITENPVTITGDSVNDLILSLARVTEALKKPILDANDFPEFLNFASLDEK